MPFRDGNVAVITFCRFGVVSLDFDFWEAVPVRCDSGKEEGTPLRLILGNTGRSVSTRVD